MTQQDPLPASCASCLASRAPPEHGPLAPALKVSVRLGSLLKSHLELFVLLLGEPSLDYGMKVVSRAPGAPGLEQMSLSFPMWCSSTVCSRRGRLSLCCHLGYGGWKAARGCRGPRFSRTLSVPSLLEITRWPPAALGGFRPRSGADAGLGLRSRAESGARPSPQGAELSFQRVTAVRRERRAPDTPIRSGELHLQGCPACMAPIPFQTQTSQGPRARDSGSYPQDPPQTPD